MNVVVLIYMGAIMKNDIAYKIE